MLLTLRSLYERLAVQVAGEIDAVAGVASAEAKTCAFAGSIMGASGLVTTWRVAAVPAAGPIAAQSAIGAAWSVIDVPVVLVAAQSGVSSTVVVIPFRYAGTVDGRSQVLGLFANYDASPLPQHMPHGGYTAFVPAARARGRFTYGGRIPVGRPQVSADIRSVGTRPAKAPRLSNEELLILMLIDDDFEQVA